MPKNCSVPVPEDQKKVLKVLTCLFDNYVVSKTLSTTAYFANPTPANYLDMAEELGAIRILLNNYLNANGILFNGENVAVPNIWAAAAEGNIAFNSNNETNTSGDAVTNAYGNVGGLKTVQKLNVDDCANRTYQVTPVVVVEGTDEVPTYTNVTQASLVERVGCSGVSNLGFICLNLQVPLGDAPFNTCGTSCC